MVICLLAYHEIGPELKLEFHVLVLILITHPHSHHNSVHRHKGFQRLDVLLFTTKKSRVEWSLMADGLGSSLTLPFVEHSDTALIWNQISFPT